MDTCIFCLEEKIKFTKEHIIPYSLGGSLTLINTVCDECNGRKLSNIEKQLSRHSPESLMRVALNIKGRKRKGEEREVKLHSDKIVFEHKESGKILNIDLKGGLKPEIPTQSFINGDSVMIASSNETEAFEKLELIKEEWKKKGLEADKIEITRGTTKGEFVKISDRYELRTIARAIAKIAYEYVCYKAGKNEVLDTKYENIRDFILKEEAENISIGITEKDPARTFQNSHKIYALSSGGRILCIVQLFGGNSYVVDVASTDYDLISTPIYFDPIKRTYYDVPADEMEYFINWDLK